MDASVIIVPAPALVIPRRRGVTSRFGIARSLCSVVVGIVPALRATWVEPNV